MNSLINKKSLVTGGGSGIGKAIVENLVSAGAQVIIHYHTSDKATKQLVEKISSIGGVVHAFKADLTKESEVKSLLRFVSEKFDGLDILVNNAGDLIGRKSLEDIDYDFYRKVMAVNLDSQFLVTREAIPLMKKSKNSSIINLSSLAGKIGGSGGSLVYSIAKGAVLTFTRSLSKELAPHGIRVNSIAPGLIIGSRFHEIHTDEEAKKITIAGIPLGRAGNCEDVARVVSFLASEYNGFITGTTIDINGGVYLS